MILGGCPGCVERLAARAWKRQRRIAFGQSAEAFDPQAGIDFIFARDHYPARRRGTAHVICACEPGAAKIGAGAVAVWGADQAGAGELVGQILDASPGARWLVLATYDGGTPQGAELALERGLDLFLTSFDRQPILDADPSSGVSLSA